MIEISKQKRKVGVLMQMQLLVLIFNKVELLPSLLAKLLNAGIYGTTVLDCEGAMRVLGQDTIEPPPIFGSLRQFLNSQHHAGKMVLSVLTDTQAPVAKKIINEVVGGIEKPDTGILFTVPLTSVEGLADR